MSAGMTAAQAAERMNRRMRLVWMGEDLERALGALAGVQRASAVLTESELAELADANGSLRRIHDRVTAELLGAEGGDAR